MSNAPAPDSVARLMVEFRKGDKVAANRLVELQYPELRKLAAAKMRGERTEHTWQTDAAGQRTVSGPGQNQSARKRGQRRSGKGRLPGSRGTHHEATLN